QMLRVAMPLTFMACLLARHSRRQGAEQSRIGCLAPAPSMLQGLGKGRGTMGIDYEAEYNNRARVPEHPQIFARWQRAAGDYGGPPPGRAGLGLSYGRTPRQIVDPFHPPREGGGPIALFIHGGYWRSLEPAMFSHLAGGLNGHDIAVALCGYDLCPQVT